MYRIIIGLCCLCIFFACTKEMPTARDGELQYNLVVSCTDTTGIVPFNAVLGYRPLDGAKVTLFSQSYYETQGKAKQYVGYTDQNGQVAFEGLAASKYNMIVEKEIIIEDTIRARGTKIAEIFESTQKPDTVYAALSAIPASIVINEIYYCGPVNKAFYFYDQFVELYNTSDHIVYLDGLIVCRALQKQHPTMETNDFVQVIYVFQFPGEPKTGREYPLYPGEFAVIAQDAYDHSQYIKTAVDLSDADWEFFDPYGGDIDSPPPNVTNILPEHTVDFMINLAHNAVVLADGSDWYYGETSESGRYQYVHIPIETVIDAVEYSSNSESTKELTTRLDAGFAGIGMTKYSGQSVERRVAGEDTDNSTIDFVILETPTPGYQHE